MTFMFEEDEVPFIMREYYKARGCELYSTPNGFALLVPQVCGQLAPLGCKIYNNRPHLCRVYDGRKDPYLRHKCKWKEPKRRG